MTSCCHTISDSCTVRLKLSMFLTEELYCDNNPCWNPALKRFHVSKFLLEMVFVVEFCRNSYVDQGAEDNHCGKNFLLCNEKWWQFNTITTTKTLQKNWFICGITLTTLSPFFILHIKLARLGLELRGIVDISCACRQALTTWGAFLQWIRPRIIFS